MFEVGDKVRIVDGSFYDLGYPSLGNVEGLVGTVIPGFPLSDGSFMEADTDHTWLTVTSPVEGEFTLYFWDYELEKVEDNNE